MEAGAKHAWLSLEEPERRPFVSRQNAAPVFIFPPSWGTALGQRRISVPALGGWEEEAVNAAKLVLLRVASDGKLEKPCGVWCSPGRPECSKAARPAPCCCPGRAPGLGGQRLLPLLPRPLESVKRSLAPRGRRTSPGAQVKRRPGRRTKRGAAGLAGSLALVHPAFAIRQGQAFAAFTAQSIFL